MPANKNHINLLPKEDFEHTTLGRIMKWALTTFRFIVIVVEFIVIAGFLFRFWLDVRISDLDDEIKQRTALISSKSSFEQAFRKTQQKTEIYKYLTAPDKLSLSAFTSIINNLPPEAQLITLSREGSVVSLTGATVNEASIATFIANLKNTDSIKSVDLSEITSKDSSPLVEFRLTMEVAGVI